MDIELVCAYAQCGRPFLRPRREYDRQVRKGRSRFYCSRSCGMRVSNQEQPRAGNVKNLRRGKLKDHLSPFRWFLRRAVARDHKGPTDLSVVYLAKLWLAQEGRCPLTGWQLVLPDSTVGWGYAAAAPDRASLDRIENGRGYVRGNVRFVALQANLARYIFTDDQLRTFCAAVCNRR